jgi:farnesyl diphosphate synthase
VTFAEWAPAYRDRIEIALEKALPGPATHPAPLHTAMRYAVLGGGKRLRPLLVYAAGEHYGLSPEQVDPIAVAIEFVHAYSLVHDDLPAMDDDDLRRGRPAAHVAFDEATAILAGDALQAHAYYVLAANARAAGAEATRWLIADLAQASGSQGMASGQALDLAAEGRAISAAELEEVYTLKTGCLISAAVTMPGRLCAGLTADHGDAMSQFGRSIGLAFQIADDLLDVEGKTEVIGKTPGSDSRNRKATYPALFGVEASRRRLEQLYRKALDPLAPLGSGADALRWLCDYAVRRDR